MNPDQCGTGRNPASLTPGDRQAVEQYAAYLADELALAEDGVTYVDPGDQRATHHATIKEDQ